MPRIAVVFFVFLVVSFVAAVTSSCSGRSVGAEPEYIALNQRVLVDPTSGCEYFVFAGSQNMVPRFRADGTPLCKLTSKGVTP